MKAKMLAATAVATLLGAAVSACQAPSKEAASPARSIARAPASSAASSVGQTTPAARGRRHHSHGSPFPGPSAPTSTASPTAAPLWTTSAPFGGTSMGGYYLYNNEWNTGAGPGQQTMWANSYHDWGVTSTQGGSGSPTTVRTYPDVQKNFATPVPVSSFSKIISSYHQTEPKAGVYNASYDLWISGQTKEVMFWVGHYGWGDIWSGHRKVTLGGQTWYVVQYGHGYNAFILDHTTNSGSVDILAGLKYLVGTGWLKASDTISQIEFGWEICWTNGMPLNFRVKDYSLTADHS